MRSTSNSGHAAGVALIRSTLRSLRWRSSTLRLLALCLSALCLASVASAQQAPKADAVGSSAPLDAEAPQLAPREEGMVEAPAEGAPRREEARKRFLAGRNFMKSKLWNEALTEFQGSRKLFPTRGNTLNEAVCLRELGRSGDALERFEELLRSFDNLTEAQRNEVAAEIGKLRQRVGTIDVIISEADAEVVVDGRPRGRTPLAAPLRVSPGTHYLRVHKAGFVTLEKRIEVVAKRTATLEYKLDRLRRSGQLTIISPGADGIAVWLDGVEIGKTPWRGEVAVGSHTVTLTGDDERGSAPAAVQVKESEPTTLRVALVALQSVLRIEPVPLNAAIAINGVNVGRGIWEGRLPAGQHMVETANDGFLTARRTIVLVADKRKSLAVKLERDPASAMWGTRTPGQIMVELGLSSLLSPATGGDLDASCEAPCAASVGLGTTAVIRGGYRFGMGIGLSLDAGFIALHRSYESRSRTLTPRGLQPNAGVVDDTLVLLGTLLGGSVSYQLGQDFPFEVRAGGGVLLGSLNVERNGRFTTRTQPTSYDVGPVSESKGATFAYANPEVRIGYRATENFVISLSASGLFLFALNSPSWADETSVLAGDCASQSAANACEGQATFGAESLLGNALIAITPGVTASLAY